MKKISVVIVLALIWLGAAQDVDAKDVGTYAIVKDGNQLPDAVLFSLTEKYRGYELISAKRIKQNDNESYRAIIYKNGDLLEVALSPNGGIRGEIMLDGAAENYSCQDCETYDIDLDKNLRRSLIDNGFNRKQYRRNLDHVYEPSRSNRNYYSRNGYNYNPYWGYGYRLYRPRYYRIYRY